MAKVFYKSMFREQVMTTAFSKHFLEIAQSLAPIIQTYTEEIELTRQLPIQLIKILLKERLFQLFIPKDLGGLESDPITFVRVVEEISTIDSATGWCLMIGGAYGLFAGLLPIKIAGEIYGSDPNVITGGSFRPTGQAVATDEGYYVTGRWPFASGCQHCTWLVGGCRIFDGQEQSLNSGNPVTRIMFFPASSCKIIDTWHSTGLRGTGSNDFTVSELFIPKTWSLSFRESPINSGSLYSFPTIALFGLCIAAVPLGIARNAINTLIKLTDVKTPTRTKYTLRHHATVQIDIARAEALLRSARAFLYESLTDAWQEVSKGNTLSVKQRSVLWLAATQATTMATQVDLMFNAGGASALYTGNPLERCLRDIRTAGQHVCVAPFNYELVGQALLDFDMSSTLLFIDDRSEMSK